MTAEEFAREVIDKTYWATSDYDTLVTLFQAAIEHGKKLGRDEVRFCNEPIKTGGTADYERENNAK